jgi:hypothetical protein
MRAGEVGRKAPRRSQSIALLATRRAARKNVAPGDISATLIVNCCQILQYGA